MLDMVKGIEDEGEGPPPDGINDDKMKYIQMYIQQRMNENNKIAEQNES